MALSIRSKQSYSSGNVDQTIASIVSGDTIVFIGTVSNNDPVQRGVDAQPTVGGVSMTGITQSTVGGQNNQVDISYLKNAAGGTNVTFHTSYHVAPAGFLGAIYVLSGGDTTTQPSGSNHAESTGAANPSLSIASLSAGDLILEGIAGNNTPTVSGGQTSDYTGTGNSSFFAIAEKSASAGSNTESWTMTSAAYAFNAIAIKVSGGAAPTNTGKGFLSIL